jgi:hypothetical protein
MPMGRDLHVIGNCGKRNLHSQSGGLTNLSVENSGARPANVGVGFACGRATKEKRVARICLQSNRLETDSSVAVRPMASPISDAIGSTRILPAASNSLVG